ncbi:MAG TPA: zf-HC2 domain-containing protein, partial [Pirellulales bacterium]|nr:zf-HC2 domain-containing protein [Pirellulales bacterium]
METRQAAHPAPRTLAAFALNRLPAEARERLQAHLRSCASCSDFLARTPQHELPARRNAEARERHHVTVQYFGNHRHRMDYPRYIAAGWQIGSGPVEAACRTVVTERLKCSG